MNSKSVFVSVIDNEDNFAYHSIGCPLLNKDELERALKGDDLSPLKPDIDAARCLRSLRAHLISIRTISAELDPQAAQRQREMIDLCMAYVQDLKKAMEL